MSIFADIRIVAQSEEDLGSFLKLCSNIQWCGWQGTCRNIPVTVDGDGSGLYKFYLLGNDNGKEDGAEKIESFEPDSDNKLWLGE